VSFIGLSRKDRRTIRCPQYRHGGSILAHTRRPNAEATMKAILLAGCLAGALVVVPATADAQLRIGVGGGPTLPTGNLADAVDAGFHAGVVLDLGMPLLPFGVRADLVYQQLPGANGGDSFRQIAAIANGRVGLLPVPLLSAYITGGLGVYASDFSGDVTLPATNGWSTDIGVNGGAGARVNLLVVRPFVEIRYHHVLTNPGRDFLPITFGIFF
jgi:hypothetical protein